MKIYGKEALGICHQEHKNLGKNLSELTLLKSGGSQEFIENIWVLKQEKTTEAWQEILAAFSLTLAPSFSQCGSAVVLKAAAHILRMEISLRASKRRSCSWGTVLACLAWLEFLWRTCAKESFFPIHTPLCFLPHLELYQGWLATWKTSLQTLKDKEQATAAGSKSNSLENNRYRKNIGGKFEGWFLRGTHFWKVPIYTREARKTYVYPGQTHAQKNAEKVIWFHHGWALC